jgi:hypothetical protein
LNPILEVKFRDLFLRRIDLVSFSKLTGFVKGKHSLPDKVNTSASFWAKSLLEEELREEMKEVYRLGKAELGLRHNQIKKNLFEGGGAVDCKYFSFSISSDQDSKDPTMAKIVRQVSIGVSLSELPNAFDKVFPKFLEEIVIPLNGNLGFHDLVPLFEDISDRRGGSVRDDEESGTIEYQSPDGSISFLLKLKEKEMILRPRSQKNCLALLKEAQENLRYLPDFLE